MLTNKKGLHYLTLISTYTLNKIDIKKRSLRLTVRTVLFHGTDASSILAESTGGIA